MPATISDPNKAKRQSQSTTYEEKTVKDVNQAKANSIAENYTLDKSKRESVLNLNLPLEAVSESAPFTNIEEEKAGPAKESKFSNKAQKQAAPSKPKVSLQQEDLGIGANHISEEVRVDKGIRLGYKHGFIFSAIISSTFP